MKKRNAYIDQFKKTDMFKVKVKYEGKDYIVIIQDSLEEFDISRQVVGKLIEEYQMATKPEYLNYWNEQQK